MWGSVSYKQPRQPGDSSEWSVTPDWETARGLVYDLFTVTGAPMGLQRQLRERFKDENVFIEVINALSNIDKPTMEQDHKQAQHKTEGYLIEDGKLWQLGGATPARVRLNTSALAGDPDPYPRVFQIQNAIPGSVRVSATG